MNIKPFALLCALLLASCGDKVPDTQGKGMRQGSPHGRGNMPAWHGKLLIRHNLFRTVGRPLGRHVGLKPDLHSRIIRAVSISEQEINAVSIWITSLWPDQTYLDWKSKTGQSAQ